MTNSLYVPELREMLAEGSSEQLREFCAAVHPARTAGFLQGLTPVESWEVLRHADAATRARVFGFFDLERQVEIFEKVDRREVASLIAELSADDRVDVLKHVDPMVVQELMPLLCAEKRRDILRLTAYREGTAGALMTTEFARVSDKSVLQDALNSLAQQAASLETIYYLYVVDDEGHLLGLLSARRLISALGRPETPVVDLMERGVITVEVEDDQEEVARTVQRYDLLAIPVVDNQRHLLGIITHDDLLDVVRSEANEDLQRVSGMGPHSVGSMQAYFGSLFLKRGLWLCAFFVVALVGAEALKQHGAVYASWGWLVMYLPLVLCSGGNCAGQSAILMITALGEGKVARGDVGRILKRELLMGLLLGGLLGLLSFAAGWVLGGHEGLLASLVVPLAIVLVVACGALVGCLLPLIYRRVGWDPALASLPCVAGIIDVVGIVIYLQLAAWILGPPTGASGF